MVSNEEIVIKPGDRGAVYVRLSDKDELGKKNESIQNQKELAKDWFNKNKCSIFEIYTDEFRSGGKDEVTFEGFKWFRPAFKRMIEDAQKNKFQFVWIKDYDRFARKTSIQESVIESFNKLGIRVFSFFNEGDTTLVRQIKGALSEDYIRKIREQTKIYHEKSLKKNKPISRPVLGYKMKYNKGQSTGKWAIHKKNSEKVIKIFEDFVFHDLSIKDLEQKYSVTQIKRILSNKKYLGIFEYYGEEKKLQIPLFLPSTLFNMAQKKLKEVNKISQKIYHEKFKKYLKK